MAKRWPLNPTSYPDNGPDQIDKSWCQLIHMTMYNICIIFTDSKEPPANTVGTSDIWIILTDTKEPRAHTCGNKWYLNYTYLHKGTASSATLMVGFGKVYLGSYQKMVLGTQIGNWAFMLSTIFNNIVTTIFSIIFLIIFRDDILMGSFLKF